MTRTPMTFEQWWKDNHDGFEGPSGEVERVAAEVWNAAIDAACVALREQARFVAASQIEKLRVKVEISNAQTRSE